MAEVARGAQTIVIAGTGTSVGKTFVAVELIAVLRNAGRTVAARKPVQSYEGDDPTDAELLARASGEAIYTVCRPENSYPLPMAPPMAGAQLGRRVATIIELAELSHNVSEATDVTVVELAGGLCSPVAADGDGLLLIEALGPAVVVLVADAGLGAINAVRVHAAVLGRDSLVVYLNRFESGIPVHVLNRQWLRDEGFVVVSDIASLLGAIEENVRAVEL